MKSGAVVGYEPISDNQHARCLAQIAGELTGVNQAAPTTVDHMRTVGAAGGSELKNIAIVIALVLPLIIAVGGGMVTLFLALNYGDKPLPVAIHKKGPVQFGTAKATERATEQALSGDLSWDDQRIHLRLPGVSDQTLRLLLWHRTAGSPDRRIELTSVAPGEYVGIGERPSQAWQALVEPIDRRFALQAPRIVDRTILEPMP